MNPIWLWFFRWVGSTTKYYSISKFDFTNPLILWFQSIPNSFQEPPLAELPMNAEPPVVPSHGWKGTNQLGGVLWGGASSSQRNPSNLVKLGRDRKKRPDFFSNDGSWLLQGEILYFRKNLGWWNILIRPDRIETYLRKRSAKEGLVYRDSLLKIK